MRVYFAALVVYNVRTRKVRSILTGVAVAISVMTVVAMGVLTHSLRTTAISILRTGRADFTVAQHDVSDVLYSSIEERDLETIAADPAVESAIGVLVAPFKLDDDHPFFLRIGVPGDGLEPFGVHIVAGRAYANNALDEVLLGFRASEELGKGVGDRVTLDGSEYQVVGVYQTGQVFGDAASMLPLIALQADQRKPGTVTLGFVRAKEGSDIEALRRRLEEALPQLATVRTEADFGQVDRNLELLSAANTGVSALALVIGAVTILNLMILSVFERTREFGVLRAIGWSRRRILAEVMSEATLITVGGAILGIALGFVAIQLLQQTSALRGLFSPDYGASVFIRALALTFGMAGLGAIYPALRAAFLSPIEAIRHE